MGYFKLEDDNSIKAFLSLVDAMDNYLRALPLKKKADLTLKIILDCKHGTLLKYERHFGDWNED